MNTHLVSLTGQGDHDFKLVSKDVFEWIVSPVVFKPGEHSKEDELPTTVFQEMKKEFGDEPFGVRISSGSPDNDRALAAPGQRFSSMNELLQHLKEHGLEIAETYEGFIY